MPILPWRAKQSTDTVGTGTLTLNSASGAGRSFNAAYGASSIAVKYVISWANGFEMGFGQFNGGLPGTLTRGAVLASSNSDALVSLPPGTKDVFAWIDAGERRVIESTATTVNLTLADLGNFLNWWTAASAGTVNLPAIATVPIGSDIEIRNGGNALLTIDANASETINGGATLTLAPGEVATLRRVTSGWVSSALPAEVFVRSQGGVLVGAIDFTLPAGFRAFRITITEMAVSTTNCQIGLRTSTNGGASFAAGASDYNFRQLWNSTSSLVGTSTGNSSMLPMSSSMDGSTLLTGDYTFFVGDSPVAPSLVGKATYVDYGGGGSYGGIGLFGGRRNAAGAVNAIRILPTVGTLSGNVTIAGIR
ncbi:hypothetical protein GXW78_07520 [Roseomonas terrae]|uniref:Uncharacterized protein n=1 Tax=Neoroseomonas terrae TaxID=424799 RepID=A0ABS5EEQ1_9PROT|nr:hypothetical protein [Neoroseomonas terrae]MBR0649503.1 hypothetical protein [Neoroseomonas terrae]